MVLFNFINPLYYALAWTVIHSIWQVFLFALLAALLQTLLRNQSAAARYNILLCACGAILLSSVLTFTYYYNLNPEEIVAIGQEVVTDPIINEGVIPPPPPAPPGEEIWSMENLASYVNNHIYIIVMIWLAGMVLALLRIMGNISYVYYLKRNMNFPVDEYWTEVLHNISTKIKLNRVVELMESALVRSPVVLGHLKPIIFFPIGAINRLSAEEVEAILAHELAHVMRNDYLMNILINIVESFYFFNPAIWWLTAQIRTEREHCCDDIAIGYTGNPLQYAKSLVAVQEMSMYAPMLAMSFSGNQKKSQLLQRVNRMFSSENKSLNVREKGIAGIVVSFLVVLILVSAKPVDNANHCLPVPTADGGQPNYLKYTYNNRLDSLRLEFEVQDGDYSFSDQVHDVKMVIQNRHVVSFNLNGLEIAGRDISKFENLITQILLEKQDENLSALESELAPAIDDHGAFDDLLNELKKDKLVKPGKINTILISPVEMSVNKNGVSPDLKNKYIKLLQEKMGQVPTINDPVHFTIILDKEGQILQHEIIGGDTGMGESSSEAIAPEPEIIQDVSYSGTYTEKRFDDWLELELIKDGYIKDKQEYRMLWSEKSMEINGIEIKTSDIKKYTQKREEMTGLKITSSFFKTKTVSR